MTILVNAPGHPNQSHMEQYYQKALLKRFSRYPFIKKCLCNIKTNERDEIVTSLEVYPKSSSPFFAKSKSHCENRALIKTIKKINKQIDSYKTKRFSMSLRLKKSNSQFVFKTI